MCLLFACTARNQPFKSECFEGQVLLLVKNVSAEGPGNDPTYAHMWEGRKRMFWVQVQGRFTVQPKVQCAMRRSVLLLSSRASVLRTMGTVDVLRTHVSTCQGTLFLGGELDGELELGLVTRSMAGMLLKVIKALSSGLHHRLVVEGLSLCSRDGQLIVCTKLMLRTGPHRSCC